MRPTNDEVEDTGHFLLLFPSFAIQRRILLQVLRPFIDMNSLTNKSFVHILLYGDGKLSFDLKKVYWNFL